ncbi:MAG TPA: glycosyl transferase [Alphaproteobacteria bacterium]|nr:glycosyl transferase [Alphaproteobacteria bacterium]
MTKRVLFYVQHLLGAGHLVRSAIICRALSEAGLDVHLISGGAMADVDAGGASVHQLAALHCAPGNFSRLLTSEGKPADDAFKSSRRDMLLALFRALKPDILITEAFPFGRRQMRFELQPLLEAAGDATPAPLILCSLRDILQTSRKPGRDAESAAIVNARYDAVLVHGDPAFARLQDSFTEAEAIRRKVRQTGIVADLARRRWRHGVNADAQVLVQAGGGAVGAALMKAAIDARPLTLLKNSPWLLVGGNNMTEEDVLRLRGRAPEGVRVERFIADLAARLGLCALSVSRGGYNSVAEILHARNPAVIVPYAQDNETEQAFRGQLLAARGLARVVAEEYLSPESLAAAIDAALSHPPPESGIDLNGARKTAAIIRDMLG